MRRSLLTIAAALVAVYSAPVAAQETAVASVRAAATGTNTYAYTVINNSATRSIVAVTIGDQAYAGVCELRTRPLGFTLTAGIPASSAATPTGWTVDAFVDEESGDACLEFVSGDSDSSGDIGPGVTATGFSVTTSAPDARYTNVHYSVVFDDGTRWSGLLERDARPR